MRGPLRPFFLTFIMAFTSTAVAWAGPITGRVVDPDGRAVRGATILLVDGTTVVATTVTDSTGSFRLTAPHDGSFDVHASLEGFRARPVPVRSDEDAGAIALQVSAVRESVIVSAAQVDIPLSATSSSVTVLTGEDLAAYQVQTLADALRRVPGLTITTAGGLGAQTSAFPRGGESDYSLVFIDGVPVNAFGGGFDFAHVPVVNIERIEIVRGPQSALYGSNAIGSVVRIITKRGGSPTASGLVEGGNFGTSRVTAATSGAIQRWHWGGSAERLISDGVVENDDYERWTLGGGLGLSSAKGGIRGDAHYTNDERGFPGPWGSDPGGTFDGINTVSRGNNDRWVASLSGTLRTGSRARLNGQVAHARTTGTVKGSSRDSHTKSRRTLGRLQADFTVTPNLQTSAGGEMQRELAGSTFITASESREVPVERTLGGVFGEARWNRRSRLFVTAGVRAERIVRDALAGDPAGFAARPAFGNDTITSVNPKIGAAWFVRSSGGNFTKIRASAGTGIRPPDAFEIAFTDNPSLKPERSRSFEAGLDQAFAAGHASIEATAFYNRYDDLIVAVGSFRDSSHYRTDNISNARTRGVELSGTARARASLMSGRTPLDVQLRVAVTLLDTEVLAVDGGSGAPPPFKPGDPLLRRPGQQFSTELLVEGPRFSSFLTVGGRSTTRDVDPSFGTFGGLFDAPGFAAWNTGAAWRVTAHVEVLGRVTNLFDRRYEEALGFPALGRGALVGLRVATGR